MSFLEPGDPDPVIAVNRGAASPFLLVCDHAGRATPGRLGSLGLPPERFDEHIAWDLGAADLAHRLAETLDACLILQAYSRLVVDCNRTPGGPQSIVAVSDGVEIPGNRGLTPAQTRARIAAIHAPYHQVIGEEIDARAARGLQTLLFCVHSFTPTWAGEPRPWHVGVLHGGKSPICRALLELLGAEPDLVVGDNQPYAMDGTDYTAPYHAWRRGLDVIEIELRQDLLATPAGRQRFADLLSRLAPLALASATG